MEPFILSRNGSGCVYFSFIFFIENHTFTHWYHKFAADEQTIRAVHGSISLITINIIIKINAIRMTYIAYMHSRYELQGTDQWLNF